MAEVTLSLDEYEALREMAMGGKCAGCGSNSISNNQEAMESPPKKRRAKSRYNREFGIQMKKLIKKHPRTARTQLMSKAHSATRKALGMKQKRSRR